MWIIVFFDLPTNTPQEKASATRFRNNLLKDGFNMLQYSVYIRHCVSHESRDVHEERIKSFLPNDGHVSILTITDKQYSNIINIWGLTAVSLKPAPAQLEFF